MITAVILAAGVVIMGGTLAAVCGYGPALDRVKTWRSARRPIRIAQLTRDGWAEVMPGSSPALMDTTQKAGRAA